MSKKTIVLRIIKAINVVGITAIYSVAWMLFYAERINTPFYARGNYVMIAVFLFLYVFFGKTYDAFLISVIKEEEIIYSQALSAFMTDGLMYVITILLTRKLPAMWPLIICLGMQIIVAVIWANSARIFYYNHYAAKKSVLIYDQRNDFEKELISHELDQKYDIKKIMHVSSCVQDLHEIPENTEVVFLSGIHSHDRNIIMKYCIAKGIQTYIIPRVGDIILQGAKPVHMLHLPILQVQSYNPGFGYVILKRGMDIVLSGIGIVLTLPIVLVTAFLIKNYDHGPVLYKQKRLTKDGRVFEVYKFRSMCVDAEKDGVARLSTGDKDDRITPVGRVIRSTRIDELPQLFNILLGDMSIVGPRPERPEIAEEYYQNLPEFRLRLQTKAGLTGYAQLYGKYNTTPYDKLLMDLWYMSNPSIVEDLKIIFATVKILFMKESTEGVAEGQTTARVGNGENGR